MYFQQRNNQKTSIKYILDAILMGRHQISLMLAETLGTKSIADEIQSQERVSHSFLIVSILEQ